MTTTLLLIDVQQNMLTGTEPVPDAAAVSATIAETLAKARSAGATIVHVRNNGGADDPDAPHTPGWELVHEVEPDEHVIDKFETDAFAATALSDLLPARSDLVVVGMQSEFCVRATSLSALRRGHRVSLVRGGHATYDGDVPAAQTSRDIEQELTAAGASIVDGASFG
jgi:nicotinamidase-related amidase